MDGQRRVQGSGAGRSDGGGRAPVPGRFKRLQVQIVWTVRNQQGLRKRQAVGRGHLWAQQASSTLQSCPNRLLAAASSQFVGVETIG